MRLGVQAAPLPHESRFPTQSLGLPRGALWGLPRGALWTVERSPRPTPPEATMLTAGAQPTLWSRLPDIQAPLEGEPPPPRQSPHPLCGLPAPVGGVLSGKWAQTTVGAGGRGVVGA